MAEGLQQVFKFITDGSLPLVGAILVMLLILLATGVPAFFLNWSLHIVGVYDARYGKCVQVLLATFLLSFCVSLLLMAVGAHPGFSTIVAPVLFVVMIMVGFRLRNPAPAVGAAVLTYLLPVALTYLVMVVMAVMEGMLRVHQSAFLRLL